VNDAVSRLSPFLRYRLILEEEVVREVLIRHDLNRVKKFIEEIGWRTFWKGWLEQHPAAWTSYLEGEDQQRRLMEVDEVSLRRYSGAISGSTGIECFDYWTRELMETGYLHNHARMWWASIWIFTLRLPWELGAAFFLQHLLDGDPASNTLSWRWVAGLQTVGKAYVARASNIRQYTKGRFDPVGQLNEKPKAITEERRPSFVSLLAKDSLRASISPGLSDSPAGFLLTPEDLCPCYGGLAESPFSSIAVFSATDREDALHLAPFVREFQREAVAETAARGAQRWSGEVVRVSRPDDLHMAQRPPSWQNVSRNAAMRIYTGHVENWVPAAVRWARREHLKVVRMWRPPVGVWSDTYPQLEAALRREGIRLLSYRRRWDETLWPYADRNFFQFREGFMGELAELARS
jgi:deoxyribodipyrimidine photo-lyase